MRTIKSFVIRQGRMTPGQKMAMEQLSTLYCLDPKNLPPLPAQTILEIGFGMGDALLHYAKANPDILYLGIEVHPPGIGRVLREMVKQQLTNIRIIQGDAIQILESAIPDGSLMQVNLFFPDPWPKARHHKRRILTPAFASVVAKKLHSAGLFHIATDWQDYAESIKTVMLDSPDFKEISNDRGDRPLTKFEQRGVKLGHTIVDYCFQKQEN